MSNAIDALRRSYLTAGLTDDELTWLAGRTQQRHYAAGATIFSEGDPGNALFVIESGEVRISRASSTGQPLTLDTLYESDAFGGLALLDGARRSATATAIIDTRVVVLYRDDFLQLVRTEPTALSAVLHNLAEMIRTMNAKIEDIARSSPAARIAKQLNAYAKRHGEVVDGGGILIRHSLSYDDLASLTGLYTADVEKIMANFQYERVVERGPDFQWTILRPDELIAAAEGPPRAD